MCFIECFDEGVRSFQDPFEFQFQNVRFFLKKMIFFVIGVGEGETELKVRVEVVNQLSY